MSTVTIRVYSHDRDLVLEEVSRLRREGKYQPPMPVSADVIAWAVRDKLEKKEKEREQSGE